MKRFVFLLAICPLLACGDTTASKKRSGSSAAAEAVVIDTPAPEAEKKQILDASPAIHLVDNRYLWHLYRDGLLLPVASEGFRKYNHEYSRPWTKVIQHNGEAGRVLASRQSIVRFGWFDEVAPATMRMRVHGVASGQRVSVHLNGKALGNLDLDTSWQSVEVEIAGDELLVGENELKFHMGKAGTVSGNKSYGLWHSVEIVSKDAKPGYGTALQPASIHAAGGKEMPALKGFPRMLHLLEVPKTAWFDVHTAGQGRFAMHLVDEGGARHTLLRHDSPGDSWQHHQISLAKYAQQLVRIELETPEGGAWGAPRIGLEATKKASDKPQAKNVILLVVDALRSDHVPLYASVYGAKSAVRMPHTQLEAEKGAAVFLHNQAASPSSPPSHGSIQTGMIPRVHGVDGDRGALKAGTPMISTQVVKAGISAGYFGNNPFGMGRLEEPGAWTAFHQPGKEGKSNDCTTLVEMMLDFSVEENKAGKRFFISSLPYETHTPYRYHEGITEHYHAGPWPPPVGKSVNGDLLGALGGGKVSLSDAQWKQLKGLYRGEGEYWDQCFGQLVAGLKDAKLLEDTVLVLTSDHGEGMFEHGRMGHAFGNAI